MPEYGDPQIPDIDGFPDSNASLRDAGCRWRFASAGRMTGLRFKRNAHGDANTTLRVWEDELYDLDDPGAGPTTGTLVATVVGPDPASVADTYDVTFGAPIDIDPAHSYSCVGGSNNPLLSGSHASVDTDDVSWMHFVETNLLGEGTFPVGEKNPATEANYVMPIFEALIEVVPPPEPPPPEPPVHREVPETAKWQIFSRYASNSSAGFAPPFYRRALLDTFEHFTATLRFNDVGTWTMTLPYAYGSSLVADGGGIQVMYGDYTVFSGSVSHWEHEWADDEDTLTVFGFTDEVWLRHRVAHPDPLNASTALEALTQYSAEYDVFSGACEDALIHYMSYNIGPSATPERQFIGTNPSSLSVGEPVVGRARFQVLLTLMQELSHAGGDCGFRIVHAGNGTSPTFEVYEPVDMSDGVVFSADRGNLLSYKFTVQSPAGNYVYLGLNQEATARYFLLDSDDESLSDTSWGRIEKFQDARDIQGVPTATDPPDLTEARQRAVAFLAENTEQTIFEAQITGTAIGARYPTDFLLGDIVGVELPEQSFDGVVRQVTITLDENGVSIRAGVTSEAGPGTTPAGRTVRDLHARTINLERR